jgi:hypothetical protein
MTFGPLEATVTVEGVKPVPGAADEIATHVELSSDSSSALCAVVVETAAVEFARTAIEAYPKVLQSTDPVRTVTPAVDPERLRMTCFVAGTM